jgi:hypothetical protein
LRPRHAPFKCFDFSQIKSAALYSLNGFWKISDLRPSFLPKSLRVDDHFRGPKSMAIYGLTPHDSLICLGTSASTAAMP